MKKKIECWIVKATAFLLSRQLSVERRGRAVLFGSDSKGEDKEFTAIYEAGLVSAASGAGFDVYCRAGKLTRRHFTVYCADAPRS